MKSKASSKSHSFPRQTSARLSDERGGLPRSVWISVFIAATGLALVLGGLWLLDNLQTWTFCRPYRVQPGTNPNHFYLVEMQSVHLGASKQDFIVRAEFRVKNSGASPVNFDARTVKVADAKGNLYDASFAPETKTQLMLLPRKADVVWCEFTLPNGALDGGLFLVVGPRHRVPIKNAAPLQAKLRDGEFRVLRRLNW